ACADRVLGRTSRARSCRPRRGWSAAPSRRADATRASRRSSSAGRTPRPPERAPAHPPSRRSCRRASSASSRVPEPTGYDPLVTGSIWFYLFPLYILGGLLLLLGVFALLGRIQGGRYLKPIVHGLMKLPLVGRLMKKASQAALERQNPELASAVKKLERSRVAKAPMRAQQALSRLSASERQAYLDATAEQTVNIAQNRQMRRQLERARKGKRR